MLIGILLVFITVSYTHLPFRFYEVDDAPELMEKVKREADATGDWDTAFSGSFFSNRQMCIRDSDWWSSGRKRPGRLWVEGYSTFDKGGSVSAIYCGPVEV